jgi:hypothetical protein
LVDTLLARVALPLVRWGLPPCGQFDKTQDQRAIMLQLLTFLSQCCRQLQTRTPIRSQIAWMLKSNVFINLQDVTLPSFTDLALIGAIMLHGFRIPAQKSTTVDPFMHAAKALKYRLEL